MDPFEKEKEFSFLFQKARMKLQEQIMEFFSQDALSTKHNLSEHLLFSYKVTEFAGTIKLEQVETGFYVSLTLEKMDSVINVKSFCLSSSEKLWEISRNLHDAAIIEIVWESIALLYGQAKRHNILEIYFILIEEEANNLTLFEGILSESKTVLTSEGEKVTFSLYALPAAQRILAVQGESIKHRMKQALWAAQGTDPYLRFYLQKHRKGTRLSFDKMTTRSGILPDNLIHFPPLR
jgi:hypothetical protein